jgi:hypothetical protein
MRTVQCSIGSIGATGRVAIPVAVSIPEAEWEALAERLSQGAAAIDYAFLAALTGSVLPKIAELTDLPPLREELARIAPGLLDGPAGSAAALLRGYLDQATQYVEAWRAGGERTRLSVVFQLLDRGYAIRSEPPVDNAPRADAGSR